MDASLTHGPTRRLIEVEGGAISLLDFGAVERPIDVVFAHANGFNAQTYRQALGPLSSALRVVAVDLRGHGYTQLPAEARTHRSWAVFGRDLLTLLDALKAPPQVILSGHSMGATASLLAAGMAPHRVRGLVLFEPVILSRLRTVATRLPGMHAYLKRNMAWAQGALRRRAVFESREAAFSAYRGRGAFRTWPDAAVADYVGGGFREATAAEAPAGVKLSCEPAWEAANYAAQANDPYGAFAKAANIPIRIWKAEHGSTCRLTGLDALQRRNRGLTIETVSGASHFLPLERPDLVREALLDMACR